MEKIEYENGSFCYKTQSGVIIADITFQDLINLPTISRFERFHYLVSECGYSSEDAIEIIDFGIKEKLLKDF